jgi:hypothetical protein
MKKMKMFLAVALLTGIGQVASAQHAQHAGHSDGQPMTHDQLRIAVQEVCPISGQKLGSMGAPVKVAVGDQKEEIFLCCQGCAGQKISPQHWATIHANIAKAQAKCPVMEKPLPENPKWTVVEGQMVYICCPPCAKKIAADPKAHLQKVDGFYAASLKAGKHSHH